MNPLFLYFLYGIAVIATFGLWDWRSGLVARLSSDLIARYSAQGPAGMHRLYVYAVTVACMQVTMWPVVASVRAYAWLRYGSLAAWFDRLEQPRAFQPRRFSMAFVRGLMLGAHRLAVYEPPTLTKIYQFEVALLFIRAQFILGGRPISDREAQRRIARGAPLQKCSIHKEWVDCVCQKCSQPMVADAAMYSPAAAVPMLSITCPELNLNTQIPQYQAAAMLPIWNQFEQIATEHDGEARELTVKIESAGAVIVVECSYLITAKEPADSILNAEEFDL